MNRCSELIKFLKNPYTEKIQLLKGRYQELDELSNIAVELCNVTAYKSLQSEMKEVFFDYLSVLAIDSFYNLIPHVLIIWVISIKWSSVTLPIINWRVNVFEAYMLAYVIFRLGRFFIKLIKLQLAKKLGLHSFTRSSKITTF